MIDQAMDWGQAGAEAYLPFVRKIATRIARRLPNSVDVEDLVGAGTVGLMEALERYDPQGGRNFETYAEFRVKGAILDELRRNDPLNRAARSVQTRIEAKKAELTSELGRPPEAEEVAAAMDTPVNKFMGTLGRLQALKVVSVAAPGRAFEAPQPSQEEQLARREMVALMKEAISELKERHQIVLNLYYVEELSQQQIGEVLNVSESRVSQILSEVTKRLRKKMQRMQA
jgi:RNA polymerase sigma factor FliA